MWDYFARITRLYYYVVKKNEIGDLHMKFHEKLQELRKDRGVTQEELADALFVSRTAISKNYSKRVN